MSSPRLDFLRALHVTTSMYKVNCAGGTMDGKDAIHAALFQLGAHNFVETGGLRDAISRLSQPVEPLLTIILAEAAWEEFQAQSQVKAT